MSLDQAYLQGLVDYETALLAQAEQQGASPEAYYQQGLVDYELMLLQQAESAGMAGSAEAHYMQGMADYEAALLQQQQAVAATSAQPDQPAGNEHEAFLLGLLHFEAELLAAKLSEAAGRLSAEDQQAYERGRAEYQAALAQQHP